MVDKNQAIIDYLIQCPKIKNSPLYFNFISAKDDNKQIITVANDKALNKAYVDGSVLKQYTFTLIDYKSVAYQALVKIPDFSNENVEDVLDVQNIIDWISEQADIGNFPNFGDDCIVESIRTVSDNPDLNSIDTTVTPALAQYSISIQVEYLDISKQLWK